MAGTETDAPTPAKWALHEGEVAFPEAGTRYRLTTHEVGAVPVPSGRLLLGDTMETVLRVPPGELRAVVTRVAEGESVAGRVAFLSLLVPGRVEARRVPLRTSDLADPDGARRIGVDSGCVHALDAEAARIPPSGGDAEWNGALLDDAEHGAALGPFLEGRPESPTALFCESGLGDGIYEVAVGVTAAGDLAALHVDFDLLLDSPAPPARPSGWWARNRTWVVLLAVSAAAIGAILVIAKVTRDDRRRPYEPVRLNDPTRR